MEKRSDTVIKMLKGAASGKIARGMAVAALMLGGFGLLGAQNSMPRPGGGGGGAGGGFGGGMGANSLPAPGSGGAFTPNTGGWGPGPSMPPPPPGGAWGSPWYGPGVNVNLSFGSPDWQNSGTVTVMGCGYDNYGVWRTIPLRVAYAYNGVQYNCTVLKAWNPWTNIWNSGLDAPAYNTSYYTHGNTYDFYTVLPTGTYYFNL